MFAKVYYVALSMLTWLYYGIQRYNKKRHKLGISDVLFGVIFALAWPLALPYGLIHVILLEGGFIENEKKQ